MIDSLKIEFRWDINKNNCQIKTFQIIKIQLTGLSWSGRVLLQFHLLAVKKKKKGENFKSNI